MLINKTGHFQYLLRSELKQLLACTGFCTDMIFIKRK